MRYILLFALKYVCTMAHLVVYSVEDDSCGPEKISLWKRTPEEKTTDRFLSGCSVTRWLNYIWNIGPVTKQKIYSTS